MAQVGKTDGNGIYVTTGVEQTAWVGSYTQIWSVGNNQASPALSFLVGQISGGGTLYAMSAGQTSDGTVTGVSSVSVADGVVTSYSVTEMHYGANVYYDALTVGTLFENGVQVQKGYDQENSWAGGSLSYAASPWNDYSVQTDHYAIAYLLSGGYYNPLYFQGGSCDEGNSDCSFWPGGGSLYLTEQAIYLGSTTVDQVAVPKDGSIAFNDDIGSVGSVLPGRTPPSGGWAMVVDKWKAALAAAWTITLAKQSQDNSAVLPFMLQTVGDCQNLNQPTGFAMRTRTYRVLDGLGRTWSNANPLVIKENLITWTQGEDVSKNQFGSWGTAGTGASERISGGTFSDDLSLGAYGLFGAVPRPQAALQQFRAESFNMSGFSYPSVFGYGHTVVPLLVIDGLSRTHKGIFGSLANEYHKEYISINNDAGNAPNLTYTRQIGLPLSACGGP